MILAIQEQAALAVMGTNEKVKASPVIPNADDITKVEENITEAIVKMIGESVVAKDIVKLTATTEEETEGGMAETTLMVEEVVVEDMAAGDTTEDMIAEGMAGSMAVEGMVAEVGMAEGMRTTGTTGEMVEGMVQVLWITGEHMVAEDMAETTETTGRELVIEGMVEATKITGWELVVVGVIEMAEGEEMVEVLAGQLTMMRGQGEVVTEGIVEEEVMKGDLEGVAEGEVVVEEGAVAELCLRTSQMLSWSKRKA